MIRIGRFDFLCFSLTFLFFLHYTDLYQRTIFRNKEKNLISQSRPNISSCSFKSSSPEFQDIEVKEDDYEFPNQIPKGKRTAIASAVLMSRYHAPSVDASPDWDSFVSQLNVNQEHVLTDVPNHWKYMENFCVVQKTKSLIMINNTKDYPKKRYPSEFYSWYYKQYIYFREYNLTEFPSNMTLLDNVYLFITRGWGGWNNIYHHTEWIHNLLRYVHHASELPRMEHVAYYPDPVNLNLTHGDPKGHYKWSISYYDLAKTAFLPNHLPHFLQGEEYAHLNMSFCARRGIIARIYPRMYDTFIDTNEPLFMKQLAYRAFHRHIRLTRPSTLSVLYLDRNSGRRGMKNRDEIVACLSNQTEVTLTIQPNTPMTFRQQVEYVLDADIFVSLHGAAITHILFMEPLGALIEIYPPNFREPFYKNMADKTQLLFYGIYSTFTDDMEKSMSYMQTDKKLNQWITVPLGLFEKTMNQAVQDVWKLKYTEVEVK